MAKKTAPLLPSTDELLGQFGARLRAARLRRRLPAKQVAARAGMAPMTLRSVERGGSGVTMGAYLAVMQVLGMERDLNLLAKADPVGRELQDARLPIHSKAIRRPASVSATPVAMGPVPRGRAKSTTELKTQLKATVAASDWIEKGGFSSADALSGLLEPSPLKKRR